MKTKRTRIIVLSSVLLLVILSILILFHGLIGSYIRTSSGIASGPTVIVDAGHGGIDGGASGVDGIVEKDINLDIALKLRDILSFYGFNVIMTRTDDNLIYDSDADTIRKQKVSDIHNRFDIIENNPDALFISIHQNKYADARQWGTQVFYSGNDPESEILAKSIQESVRDKLQPDNNRRVKKSGTEIYLLYYAKSPAVMVECGFISNRGDAQKLKNDDYRMKTAALIADGIIKYTEMSEKMPEKAKTVYVCNDCGHESAKWYGRCPSCGEWNTMEEVIKSPKRSGKAEPGVLGALSDSIYKINDIKSDDEVRYLTGMKELDRVLGGGVVKGSLVLLSGDPGIGKSTLLLQICQYLGRSLDILYVSGEESAHQIKLRAARLGVDTDNLSILCMTDIQRICEYMRTLKPGLVIIDSIQTMNISEISSSIGSIAQVRECTNCLMQTSKALDIPTIVVGHVNKDGNIAGPKVLEHIVDAVLYFEGERHLSYRILRAVKNRYGSTNEIGVFEMKDDGLSEVENPSQMLISGRPKNTSGSCVACLMEGSRPILAEVQALVSGSGFGNPRRTTNGFDYNRLAMLIAVLEKRCGYNFANSDVYINVVGGLRLDEPASDLSVALSLISSLKDIPIMDNVIAFGEIGLGGEIRSIGSCEQRIKEAARLGFTRCIVPYHNYKNLNDKIKSLTEVIPARTIRAAYEAAT